MRRELSALGVASMLAWAGAAHGANHPAGVSYPLTPAALQPTGLAHPLPSTRRYVLVWKDQLINDSYSQALMQWVVGHYVGTQKLFQLQIDAYRALNPSFLMLVYHLSYGLNGADQPNPVGNITGANTYGQEDTDTFTPWVAANNVTRENAYEHTMAPPGVGTRVSYPDPYWLMDITSAEWNAYLKATLLQWAAFPTAKADGFFFDVGFYPWYNYSPNGWWSGPAGDGSRQGLVTWWGPLARTYFDGLRQAFAPDGTHPRYLVIPNPDALVDGTDEPTFLDGTDGVFTENWQSILGNSGNWNLSMRRLCHYVTGHGKVWMVDVTQAGTSLTQGDREMIIGSFLLARNGTSYVMIGGGDLSWFPEYELDLGGYVAEPPDDLEQLRVAGQGGPSGGLYLRQEVAGMVLVNSSMAPLTYMLASPMKQAGFSGGGPVDANGNESPQTLTYTTDVPAGMLTVNAQSVVILRSSQGAPPPGVEPGGGAPDGGAPPGSDGGPAPGRDGGVIPPGGDGGINPGVDGGLRSQPGGCGAGSGGGCGCRTTSARAPAGTTGLAGVALGLLLALRRLSGRRSRRLTRSGRS